MKGLDRRFAQRRCSGNVNDKGEDLSGRESINVPNLINRIQSGLQWSCPLGRELKG